jgi:3-hydroxy-9,10-secoandrosta-1,3,5(10)-triene-9,17-dione monooxygenase reductase component
MQQSVDPERFRSAMRRVPTPVTVVTAVSEKEARGVTIGSFTSLELNPPLITFNLARDSQMHDVLLASPRFAVHVLAADQAHLAGHFAEPDMPAAAQLEQVDLHFEEDGLPVIPDTLAVLFCSRHAFYEEGEHLLVVGRVERIEFGEERPPLLYLDRAYRQPGPQDGPRLLSDV